jgi:hypothetical protein
MVRCSVEYGSIEALQIFLLAALERVSLEDPHYSVAVNIIRGAHNII